MARTHFEYSVMDEGTHLAHVTTKHDDLMPLLALIQQRQPKACIMRRRVIIGEWIEDNPPHINI